jgi:GMP reductase
MVMVGGMFSALTDSPGSTVRGTDGQLYKEFWGSASAFQSGKVNRIEGTKKLLPLKNRSILEEMNYLRECLQSAISYGGGKTVPDLKLVTYF